MKKDLCRSRFPLGMICSVGIWLAWATVCSGAPADDVDDLIAAQMSQRHIPGLSLAIIQDGRIVKEKGYGLADPDSKTPVTPATLFQAASISKAVAATGALWLVERGTLSLDADVNSQLRTWKVPDNPNTRTQKVTLRRILSHTAALTVHGFSGYDKAVTLPTLVQILDGVKPANSPAIRVDGVPGSQWRYSGGGYTVMQQLILDVTSQSFPDFMRDRVLKPFDMLSSTYEQPLPTEKTGSTAAGYYPNGKPVEGRWHVYPEMAAAGLWTTPSDLARFLIGIQQSLAGKSNPVISQTTTRQMLTIEKQNDGLGLFVQQRGTDVVFYHDGRNEGFDSYMVAYAGTGQGAVIMINTNDNFGTVERIVNAIAKEYRWPPSR